MVASCLNNRELKVKAQSQSSDAGSRKRVSGNIAIACSEILSPTMRLIHTLSCMILTDATPYFGLASIYTSIVEYFAFHVTS
jgi:hypothetical protein